MTNEKSYPPGWVQETASQAIEIAVRRLKMMGKEAADLAEVVDAAFLIWQLAEDSGTIAQQTIGETLPILLSVIYGERQE